MQTNGGLTTAGGVKFSPTRIGILLTEPQQEAVKEEIVQASWKRPWIYKVDKSTGRCLVKQNESGKKSGVGVPTDVSTALYIRWKYAQYGVEVDMIPPEEISAERLAKNDLNFFLIYDLLEAFHTDKSPGKKKYKALCSVLENSPNVYPPMSYQKLINSKIKYYSWLRKMKVAICPTRTLTQRAFNKMGRRRAAESVLAIVRKEGWKKFCAKPVFGQESIDVKFFTVTQKARFTKYLAKCMARYPGMVFQKYLHNFGMADKGPEVRMYHVGEDYKYSVIGTEESIHTPAEEGGKMKGLPMHELRKQAVSLMAKLPVMEVQGKQLPRLLTRLDMGCYIDGELSPFVNEIEFVPSLYFDHTPVARTFKIDAMLGDQIVNITRTFLHGTNDMASITGTDGDLHFSCSEKSPPKELRQPARKRQRIH